jgi:hypothetical protein
MAIKAT